MTLMLYSVCRKPRVAAVLAAAVFFITLMLVGAWVQEKPCYLWAMLIKNLLR